MAHQTDVHQFQRAVKGSDPNRRVIDPNCGMKMKHKDVKHILFRAEGPLYFCSKECEGEFIRKKKTAA